MKRIKHTIDRRQEEIFGILLMAFSLLIFLSLVTHDSADEPVITEIGQIKNALGIAGVYISDFLIRYVIGYPSLVLPMMIFLIGWTFFRGNDLVQSLRISAYLLAFAVHLSIILALPDVFSRGKSDLDFSLSGLVGGLLAQVLFNYLGMAGSIVVLLALIMITVIGATRLSLSGLVNSVSLKLSYLLAAAKRQAGNARAKNPSTIKRAPLDFEREINWSAGEKIQPTFEEKPAESKPRIQPKIPQLEMELGNDDEALEDSAPTEAFNAGNYTFPSLDLLAAPGNAADEMTKEELQTNARILEDRLLEFDVQGKVVEICPGPVITRYEFEPAPGIKISRIASLADDLALAMRAKRIRIVAPIPGKAVVGVEIPNRKHQTVYLREVLNAKPFQQSDSPLTMALGKTIAGDPFVTKLDDMPHLLIAGATGSGKSVCLNSIIASILYKAHPTQVQMVMIDPKRLELSIYNNLRHHHLTYREDLNEEVVTNSANAISVLKSVETIMERRYEILARAGVRNIRDYNWRLKNGQLKNLEQEAPYEPLEYLLVIIDELADLMLTAAREVEEPIARLTQMSRAVGIHLIVATQRPSVDVITGVIKANFPARIAFQVASKTDSRTILDLNGAEKLLGMGDMLFILPGSPEPVRIHGAFVSTDEIERIIAHIRKQPRYPKNVLPVSKEEVAASYEADGLLGSRDELFNEAAKLVVRHQQGSISLLQRRLKVGYARAARLIDELEAAGVVGPFDGSKAREVLIADENDLGEMGFN
jgi:S-DNA-T family DNA segregation ATPase FtsK/SpoIIIE